MPMLQQYGPRSLNFVSKKKAIKKIMIENSLLKAKIAEAKSSVTRDDLALHQAKSDLQTLLVKSASRQSFTSFNAKPELSKVFPFTLDKKRFLSLDPTSPRDQVSEIQVYSQQTLILPDITNSRNLAPVVETTIEVARTPFLNDIGVKTVNRTMLDQRDDPLRLDDPQELSRLSVNRKSHNSIINSLNDGTSLRINTKHFKGFNVPAHARSNYLHHLKVEQNEEEALSTEDSQVTSSRSELDNHLSKSSQTQNSKQSLNVKVI